MLYMVNRRNVFRLLALIISVVVIFFLAWIIVAGPVTVSRIIRYGDTNIDDYRHYPGRELSPGALPSAFARGDEEIQLSPEALEGLGSGQNLEAVLQSNDSIAFLVVKDEAIVYERYFQGHNQSALSQLFSVTKSVTSALIGMAIADGYIDTVDQPITDFIPELAGEGFAEVTIHHLLTMSSGSSYQENDNPFGEHVILNYTPQLEGTILTFDMEAPPGTVFRYKSGDNALLGLALARALEPETVTQYAQRRLWTPIGMQDPAMWTIDHEGNGLEKTWCCLATSARDLARLGRLYLNQGVWANQQVLPAEWIAHSTQAQVPAAQWPGDYRTIGWRNYGYQWWLASEEAGDYFGLGKDGQFLYVNPATETIVVRLGRSQGELPSSQWISLFQSIATAR